VTIQVIPTFAYPFWTQVTALDGVDYTLTFTYDQRESVFYLTISDAVGNDIVSGVKLVCKWPLLAGKRDVRLPPGVLMVLSNTTDSSPPGLEDLVAGGRCQLFYLPKAG
jgi:hypothetical protein